MTNLIIRFKLSELKKEIIKLFLMTRTENLQLLSIFSDAKKSVKRLEKTLKTQKLISKLEQKIFKKIIYYFASFNTYGLELRTLLAYLFIVIEIKRLNEYATNLAKYYTLVIERQILSKQTIKFWKDLLINFDLVANLIEKANTDDAFAVIKTIQTKGVSDILPNLQSGFFPKNQPTQEIYYFFMQFRFLDRTADRLINICEHIIFLKSFFGFRNYQKEKRKA